MSGYFQKPADGLRHDAQLRLRPRAGGQWRRRALHPGTLKEQIVFGRIYQNIEEVRAAARAYFERYNQHWLLEKNGYRSPAETRRTWMARTVTKEAA